jgi:hypothetical protein
MGGRNECGNRTSRCLRRPPRCELPRGRTSASARRHAHRECRERNPGLLVSAGRNSKPACFRSDPNRDNFGARVFNGARDPNIGLAAIANNRPTAVVQWRQSLCIERPSPFKSAHNLRAGSRGAKIPALRQVGASFRQSSCLLRGFHPFRQHLRTHGPKCGDRAGDLGQVSG